MNILSIRQTRLIDIKKEIEESKFRIDQLLYEQEWLQDRPVAYFKNRILKELSEVIALANGRITTEQAISTDKYKKVSDYIDEIINNLKEQQ